MSEAIDILAWTAIALWVLGVYFLVPEAPGGPARDERYWLAYKLFGGTRGPAMFAGVVVIGLVKLLVFGSSAAE
jgi:hypothetical protein